MKVRVKGCSPRDYELRGKYVIFLRIPGFFNETLSRITPVHNIFIMPNRDQQQQVYE